MAGILLETPVTANRQTSGEDDAIWREAKRLLVRRNTMYAPGEDFQKFHWMLTLSLCCVVQSHHESFLGHRYIVVFSLDLSTSDIVEG